MDAIFPYIFKSALALMLLFSLYGLLLRRETLHDFNRVVLLSILTLSFALPLVQLTAAPNPINVHLYAAQQFVAEQSPFLPLLSPTDSPLTWGELLTALYIVGAAIALMVYAYRLVVLSLLIAASRKVEVRDGTTICLDPQARSPYNWWRWVVLSEEDWRNNAHALLPHELAHARLGHSWDMLFCELAVRLQWFNPMAWNLRDDLRAVHEFQADRAALASGISSRDYQLLLIKKAVSPGLQPAANSLNSSSLKQRLIMMYAQQSQKWVAAKALYLLPLAAVALLGYAQPAVLQQVATAQTTRQLALDTSVAAQDDNKTAKTFVLTTQSATDPSKKQTTKVVALNGKANALVVNNKQALNADSMLVVIDGKEASADALRLLNPNDIAAVNVLKGETMQKLYPDDRYARYNSAVQVTTRANAAATSQPTAEKQRLTFVSIQPTEKKSLDDALIVVDGQEMPTETLQTLKPERIASMSVLKGKAKSNLYPNAKQSSVVLITTKDNPKAAAAQQSPKAKVVVLKKD